MKVFQAVAAKQGAFIEVEAPKPTGDQVLVRVCYCGVCGTDYDLFSGDSNFVKNKQATYPIRLGHEWSGVVAAVGEKVTRLKVGDRVVGDNYVTCGTCEACRAGDYNNCTGRMHVGTIDPCWPGAFAEYFMAPQRHVYRLADHVSLKEAALCEPLSVAYGGTKKMDIRPESVVAVIGTGPIALAAAALALERGAQVFVVGRNDKKLAIAQRMGVTGTINIRQDEPAQRLSELTNGRMANFILECSGSPVMVKEVVRLGAPKAVAALIGFYNSVPEGVDFSMLVAKEMKLIGIMGEYGNLEAVAGLMAQRDMKLGEMITGEMPFDRCGEALAPEDHSGVVKTIIQISEE